MTWCSKTVALINISNMPRRVLMGGFPDRWSRHVAKLTDASCGDACNESGLNRPRETSIKHADIVPDWLIALLVAPLVAGVFGGVGVLVLGIVAATFWIAQIIEGRKLRHGRDRGTGITGIKAAIKSSGSY